MPVPDVEREGVPVLLGGMGGTTCQAFLIDRRLGDYFTIDVDTTGALVFAYSDTRQGGGVALPAFVRQLSGPSFQKRPPIKAK